jgi:hypothetical protein
MTTEAVSSSVMVPQGRGGLVAHFAAGAGTTPAFDKGDSPSFSDLIDIINPLQHIPVVNTVYRAITGDHESAMADVIGGAIYGGPVGAAFAVADLGLRDATGKTVGEHAVALLGIGPGGDTAKPGNTAVAAAAQPAAQVAAAQVAAAQVAAPQVAPAQTKTLTSSIKPAVVAASAPAAAPAAAKTTATAAKANNGLILTPARLVANETVEPAVQATAAQSETPAIVPTVSPYAAPVQAGLADGPKTMGDYLVFGGAGPEADQAAPAPQAKAAAPVAAKPKEFAVLGAGAAPTASLPTTAATSVTAAAPAPMQVASARAGQPRVFPIPARNGPATPVAVLPPPTTGPGALPGGKSMALSAQESAVMQDPQHNFLTAYTQALDKYRSAQRLADETAGASAAAPTSLMQPAAAVVPADPAASGDSAVTLH